MSVNALKPNFHDRAGYKAWRKTWSHVYQALSQKIIAKKAAAKQAQRGQTSPLACQCGNTPTLSQELLPGSESRWHQVICEDCGMRGPLIEGCSVGYHGKILIQSYRNKAIAKWNRMISPGSPQRDLRLFQADATKMMTLLKEAKLLLDRINQMHKQIAEQPFPLTLEDCRNVDFHFNKISLTFPFMPRWVLKTRGMTLYINHIEASIPWSTRELDKGSTPGMIRFKRASVNIDRFGVAHLTSKELAQVA